jgi:hypothetical protein
MTRSMGESLDTEGGIAPRSASAASIDSSMARPSAPGTRTMGSASSARAVRASEIVRARASASAKRTLGGSGLVAGGKTAGADSRVRSCERGGATMGEAKEPIWSVMTGSGARSGADWPNFRQWLGP